VVRLWKTRQIRQRFEDEVHQTATTIVKRDQVEREIEHIKGTRLQHQKRYIRATNETCRSQHEIAATRATLLTLEDDTFRIQLEFDESNLILKQQHETLEKHESICKEIRAERETLATSVAQRINDNKAIKDEISSIGHAIMARNGALWLPNTAALKLHVTKERIREEIKHYSREIDQLVGKLRRRDAKIDELRSKIESSHHIIEQGAIEHGYQESIIY
jgi:chromosome segregation ATPase